MALLLLAAPAFAADAVELGPAPTYSGSTPYTGRVSAVVCSATDPDLYFAAGADGGVWRTADGALLYTLEGHTDGVYSVTFSPDGKRVLSLDADGIAMIWPVDPLSLLERNPPRELTLRERLMYDVWGEGEEKSSHLIDRLFKEFSCLEELVVALSKDPNLSEKVRTAALVMAKDLTALSEKEEP